MTKFDDIWETATDAHGLITSREAQELGVTNHEMVEFARRGRLERVGHGIYRLAKRVPEKSDAYALAVKLTGPDAYLYGESVIALLELAPTDPSRMFVATPRRIRRNLPAGMHVTYIPNGAPGALYDGISAQRAVDAIRSASSVVGKTRLVEAAREGRRLGYLRKDELDTLEEEFGSAEKTQ